MRWPYLILDHDDTVVKSTETIHYPCFAEYMRQYHPRVNFTFEDYIRLNFDPGVIGLFRDIIGMDADEMAFEEAYWRKYAADRTAKAFDGMKQLMEQYRRKGGKIIVVSHSFSENIIRDYVANDLPLPDKIFGWECPADQRKPSPYPIRAVIKQYGCRPEEVLVVDDLKPGYDMAAAAGVAFAGAGWAYNIPEIERFMQENCGSYFRSIEEFSNYLLQ